MLHRTKISHMGRRMSNIRKRIFHINNIPLRKIISFLHKDKNVPYEIRILHTRVSFPHRTRVPHGGIRIFHTMTRISHTKVRLFYTSKRNSQSETRPSHTEKRVPHIEKKNLSHNYKNLPHSDKNLPQ